MYQYVCIDMRFGIFTSPYLPIRILVVNAVTQVSSLDEGVGHGNIGVKGIVKAI